MMTEQVHGSSINHSKTMPPPSHKPLTMHTFSSATPRHSELVEPLPITMDFIRIEIQCTEYGDQTRLQSTHASHRILQRRPCTGSMHNSEREWLQFSLAWTLRGLLPTQITPSLLRNVSSIFHVVFPQTWNFQATR